MPSTSHTCPICGATGLRYSPRYPDYVCRDCVTRAVSAEGRLLSFSNVSLSGGFLARHRDDGTTHDSHVCFIDGHRCWADEARFGGIVVQPGDEF